MRLTGVSIVRYVVEEEGSLAATIDMAVAIHTKQRTYTFSRGVFFASEFFVAAEEGVYVDYGKDKFATGWAGKPDEGDPPQVVVTRNVIDL